MSRIRVIPILLLQNGRLVKTVRFRKETYIGDPINAVKIFNEKEVDELIFLDISATSEKKPPDMKMIADIASECFMPVAYGGGISTIEQIKAILAIGIEKVCVNQAALKTPHLLEEAKEQFGSQSVVVSLDVQKDLWGTYRVYSDRGKMKSKYEVVSFAKEVEAKGAGEILLTSIDRDGTFQGYDTSILAEVARHVRIPIVACGGAGKVDDFATAIKAGASAVAAGSMFVFHGPLRGVLINFPTQAELTHKLYSQSSL